MKKSAEYVVITNNNRIHLIFSIVCVIWRCIDADEENGLTNSKHYLGKPDLAMCDFRCVCVQQWNEAFFNHSTDILTGSLLVVAHNRTLLTRWRIRFNFLKFDCSFRDLRLNQPDALLSICKIAPLPSRHLTCANRCAITLAVCISNS